MVDSADFIAKMSDIFREQLDDDGLKLDMKTVQSDLAGWDSLAHVRIVMGIERAYGVQLDVAEIEGIKSVRGFYEAVNAHLASN